MVRDSFVVANFEIEVRRAGRQFRNTLEIYHPFRRAVRSDRVSEHFFEFDGLLGLHPHLSSPLSGFRVMVYWD